MKVTVAGTVEAVLQHRVFLLSTSFPEEELPSYGSQFLTDILLNHKWDTSSVPKPKGEIPLKLVNKRESLPFHRPYHQPSKIIHDEAAKKKEVEFVQFEWGLRFSFGMAQHLKN